MDLGVFLELAPELGITIPRSRDWRRPNREISGLQKFVKIARIRALGTITILDV